MNIRELGVIPFKSCMFFGLDVGAFTAPKLLKTMNID